MKRSLVFKLSLCYIILISIFYLAVNGLSSVAVNNYLYSDEFSTMSDYAESIQDDGTVSGYFSGEVEYDALNTYISSLDQLIPPSVWIIDSKGNIIIDSTGKVTNETPVNILELDKSFFSNTSYESLYIPSIMSEECTSIIRKISDSNNIFSGYIVLNLPEERISSHYAQLISQINMLSLISLPLTAIVFILIYFLTIAPVHKITRYAVEYSKGKFDYKLVIKSNDEYKQLADAIEYMVGELNNLDEYQKKFIGNISHDFRSPLTSIKGYVEAMLDGTIPIDNQEKYLKIILFESERLTDLTTNLLTLNNFDNNKRILDKKNFDINNIISKTADVYEGRCSKNKIEIVCNFESDVQYVYADQSQIQQVINNLVDNAIKFSPQYSKIVLSTFTRNEKIFVSIKDSGSGIPKNAINRVWERFYKTDPSRGKDKKGTGLGLAITKEIINAHRENINVVSTEGVGTEFIFSLSKPNRE